MSRFLRVFAALAVLLTVLCVGASAAPKPPKPPPPTGIPPAPPGYSTLYSQAFNGTAIPAGWHPYYGQAGSDTAGWWDPSHDVVNNGLTLRTFQDPSAVGPNSPWVEGGISCWPQCVQKFGEWLVHSRVTSANGVTQVELLWPYSGSWPPEVDFNESNGTNESTATFHWGTAANNFQSQATVPSVDLTQWHTWGVIATRKTITYTLDGKAWATMPNQDPVPMDLAIQQQVWPCSNAYEVCPTSNSEVDLQVSWVAVYAS